MHDLLDFFKLIKEEKKKENYSLIGDSAVTTLEKKLILLKDISYFSIDKLMKSICSKFNISTKKLHNDFVKKNKMIPDEWIKEKRKPKY
jgi:hypothetical protein